MTLHHLVREPKIKLDKNPLLLLLHGYGSNEEDLFSFASELPEEYYVISARAPYDMMYGSYAWYAINFDADENKFSDIGQAQTSRDLIANFIDEVVSSYAIDANKVTLIGFSQGCILSYAVAVSYPEKVQRVVAMSGYFNEEIATENFKDNDLSKLKIFASHGSVDQVVPVDWARNSIPKIKDLGVEIVYKEYPIGHGVSPQNFYDFKNWLQENF
ncbi:alpha/beta fold hydrolase [Flavobacterium sp.]|uniref:alpha/beta hydrolase n=1 Tax=Flavobacterium sp. TaxID=239 RepID=UPI002627ECFB|nr:alpha/beta fold hydrolase [Flavobacterium sp.]